MERRGFMGAVAAAALASYDDEPFGPEDIDEWDPMDGNGIYTTGDVEAAMLRTEIEGPIGGAATPLIGLADASVQSYYPGGNGGVLLGADARGEQVSTTVGIELDPETAKELAAALYRAAWELENRPRREGTEP